MIALTNRELAEAIEEEGYGYIANSYFICLDKETERLADAVRDAALKLRDYLKYKLEDE